MHRSTPAPRESLVRLSLCALTAIVNEDNNAKKEKS